MFGLKKHFIKSMIKIDVVNNIPGSLTLHAAQISQVEDEYKSYEHFAIDALKLLKGINSVKVDYENGLVTIKYNNEIVTAGDIQNWIDAIVDVVIDNKDFIKDNWEKDVNLVWDKMKPILLQSLNNLGKKR